MQPKYFQQTPLEEEAHYDHEECNDRKGRLYVRRQRHGWVYHCFNCGESGFKRSGPLPPRETLKMIQGQTNCPGAFYMPPDLTDDIPLPGQLWLEKYEITDEERKRYQLGYSKKLDRLILPVIEAGEWVFWQGRNLGKVTRSEPKYLSAHVSGKAIFFQANLENPVFCIVEDILSGIKVGRVFNGIALLGSHVPVDIVPLLQGKRGLLWLDYDKRMEAMKAAARLRSVWGIDIQAVATRADPKAQTMECIQAWRNSLDDRVESNQVLTEQSKLPETC